MVKVRINGKEENVKKGSTILAVLEEKSVQPEMVAVELNGDLLEKEELANQTLNQGDTLEFLYYMAGGD